MRFALSKIPSIENQYHLGFVECDNIAHSQVTSVYTFNSKVCAAVHMQLLVLSQ